MNSHEKKLIEAFLNKENKQQHNRAVELLFYGRKIIDGRGKEVRKEFDVTRSIKNAVSISYSGALYAGKRKEVYDTFVSLFHAYLEKMNPEKFIEIENLEKWMFIVAKNFANSHRKELDSILGIESNVICFENKMDKSEDEPIEATSIYREDNTAKYNMKIPEKDDEDSAFYEQSSKWAEDLIEEYINRISNPYYREILHVVDIYGMAMIDYAEERGVELNAIHRDHKRAMDALIQVALPDIRWRSRKLYGSFRDKLDSIDKKALDNHFNHNIKDDKKVVVNAYVKLLKVAKREEKVLKNV